MAKGMIDEDHPLSIGCIERGKRQMQRAFLRKSDLIVGLGYDTIEVEYEAWIGDTPLLQVDIEKVDVAPSVQVKGEVTGDLDEALSAFVGAEQCQNDWTDAEIESHRTAFQAALRPNEENFSPHEAIDVVRDMLPVDGILTFDVGEPIHIRSPANGQATRRKRSTLLMVGLRWGSACRLLSHPNLRDRIYRWSAFWVTDVSR